MISVSVDFYIKNNKKNIVR